MLAEQLNPRTEHIDEADTLDILRLINEKDQQVPLRKYKPLP